MDQRMLDQYLQQAQSLATQPNPSALLKLIQQKLDAVGTQQPFYSFFLAEKAFYTENYDLALKHYLDAKEIPSHGFFCYRASAYVSKSRGEPERAASFAKKALQSHPDDISTAKLLQSTLEIPEEKEECRGEPFDELFAEEFSPAVTNSAHPSSSMQTVVQAKLAKFTHAANNRTISSTLVQEPYHVHPFRQGDAPLAGSILPQTESEAPLSLVESRIQQFLQCHRKAIKEYMERGEQSTNKHKNFLAILNGSKYKPVEQQLTERSRNSDRGIFIRWNNKGIVINPGRHFIMHFHAQGYYVREIDYVVVTRDHPEAYADIQEIYDLNAQLNKAGDTLHLIQYYLNQNTFQELSGLLKPLFKQERNTVHPLELFLDSTEVEHVELYAGARLNYFAAQTLVNSNPDSLGIRLDLRVPDVKEQSPLRFGYLSGLPWSPLLAHHLGPCDILFCGFGNTSNEDLAGTAYTEESLGFNGTLSLIDEIQPNLVLCGEFGGRNGDIRLEAIEKMRQLQKERQERAPDILPAENGLRLNLDTFRVVCNLTREEVEPEHLRIAKASDSSLLYLSRGCCI